MASMPTWFDHKGRKMMGVGLCLHTKREILRSMLPQYRQATLAQKRIILDEFTQLTGYHRKYAMWLLNHTEEGQSSPVRPRPRQYGAAVQEALVQVWDAANRIAAKRFMPFLPTLVEALERYGHLHLSDTDRSQLLTMSVATADRLLRMHRGRGPSGLSTTRPGTLLKQQIPIRTFQQWNETQPGFLEADLVAHGGVDTKGSFLYTLTLTDIATGWTECLPLLSKCQDSVLDALRHAREFFPFPILGLDTDNGGEFINEAVLSYCEQEQITFTRGRPTLKNDQCYVEQKNGNIVRQVVGYDLFVGMQAYQQLGEVYRALHIYVNCFQPSMKLQAKQVDGRKVHLVYDEARTPLQRLMRSKVLSDASEQALMQMFRVIDPILLFAQVKEMQQALFTRTESATGETETLPVRRFCVERCLPTSLAADVLPSALILEQHEQVHESPSLQTLLDWPRTRHDPFKDVWELIASWVIAHPERNCGEMFRELQCLFPERYQPFHLRTLQRGVRKIRACLQETRGEQWQEDILHEDVFRLSVPKMPGVEVCQPDLPVRATTISLARDVLQEQLPGQQMPFLCPVADETKEVPKTAVSTNGSHTLMPDQEQSQGGLLSQNVTHRIASRPRGASLSIEQAIQAYLEAQRRGKRRPKTLEWHQTALHLFQQYLLTECQCDLIHQITEAAVQGWFTFLRERPTARGMFRAAGTIASYARSARAFCQWLVRQRYLMRTPFVHLHVPHEEPGFLHLVEPEEWERLLLACQPGGEKATGEDQAAARNQAVLWILAETGMRTAEVCGMRLSDVDREQGRLRVQGKGSTQRWVPLGYEGFHYLCLYLDHHRLKAGQDVKRRRVGEEPLFLSKTGHPLTSNGIALLFGRLRKQAGITRKEVGPVLLRDTFAVRYLQEGGDLLTLRQQLGQEESAVVKRHLGMSYRKRAHEGGEYAGVEGSAGHVDHSGRRCQVLALCVHRKDIFITCMG
ncbi:integrase family protein [Ktedonobacter racemifer DSM 44963]|uniref:Integrase family protein n=1 Tax=Ktedonobacter racemifer DSM 44963 TaxID=485913 RepID=D6TK94_KTERA|nr:integrase family protein [Ktedonobacter racemifer DSM 44963]